MGKPTVHLNKPTPLLPHNSDSNPNGTGASSRRAARALGTESELKSHSPLAERANAPAIPSPARPSEPATNAQSRSACAPHRLTEPNVRFELDTVAGVTRSVTRSGATPSTPVSSFVARVATRSNDSPLSPLVRAPEVRVLLCADEPGNEAEYVINSNNIKCFKAACMANIPGLEEKNIRTNLFGKEVSTDVGTSFCWFFNPCDTVPGDMRILLVTGHGYLDTATGAVSLKLFAQTGTQIDTTVLHAAINKLPERCTLEVVMGTCFAEGTVSGLHRIEVMGARPNTTSAEGSPARSTYVSQPTVGPGRSNPAVLAGGPLIRTDDPLPVSFLSRLSGLMAPRASPSKLQLNTKATVILWAAASANGKTFAEAPQSHKRQLCVLIGAIYRAWGPGKSKITRREVCAKIRKANLTQDQARLEYYALNPSVQMPVGADKPGMAILLCSSDDRERVLDSPIFQPLDPPPLHKSLVASGSGSSAGEK